MIYGKLKKTLELITKHLSVDDIIKNKKKIIEEFCNTEDFNLPESEKNKIIHPDRIIYEYRTKIFNDKKEGEVIVKTKLKEYDNKIFINYSVNDSFDKQKNYSTKTTLMLISIVTLNFLNFLKDFDSDKPFYFNTRDKSMSKIDTFLLELCKKFIPTFKYIEEKGDNHE